MTVRTATLVQNIMRSYLILISAGITMKRHKCMTIYIRCAFADNKIRVDFMETFQKYLHRQALRRSFLGSSTFRTSPATKNMCRSDITLMSTFQESEFSFFKCLRISTNYDNVISLGFLVFHKLCMRFQFDSGTLGTAMTVQ